MSHRLSLPHRQPVQRRYRKSFALASTYALLCTALLQATTASASSDAERSTKRGLIDITTLSTSVEDNAVLIADSDITWYYNYGSWRTEALVDTSLQFVPQIWGDSDPEGFATNVTDQLAAGANITTILGFNEPDGCDGGGACINVTQAVKVWKEYVQPLKTKHGLKLGSPAPTGSQTGLTWLKDFFEECGSDCVIDFIPLHWYGDFKGLASWIGQINATFLSNVTSIWVTEFAYEDATLAEAITFFNESTDYMDRLEYIGRYSYFGAFRSDVSNVGDEVTFFNDQGNLTDLGEWYKGNINTTGVLPVTTTTATSSSYVYTSAPTTTSKSGAGALAPEALISVLVVGMLAALRLV